MGSPGITAYIPEDPEELRRAFPDFLAASLRAASRSYPAGRREPVRSRVIIFMGLRWLPEDLPANAHFILSALEGPVLEELRGRPRGLREIELQPLTVR